MGLYPATYQPAYGSSGTVTVPSVPYVPAYVGWSSDAPYQESATAYDSFASAYDSPTARYDGTDPSLLLPLRSSWNPFIAAESTSWVPGSLPAAASPGYDSFASAYDSPTATYDGTLPSLPPERSVWTPA